MRVVVIGGGIIGVAAAYRLAEAGMAVTLLERGARVGGETSFSNAGQISPTLAAPWAVPGLLGKAAKWAFMRHPPLRLRHAGAETLDWLWRMIRAANAQRFLSSKRAMVALSMLSLEEMRRARDEAGLDYPRGGSGTLVLLRDAAAAKAYEGDLAILHDMGLPFQRLDRESVLAREPNMRRDADIVGGVLLTLDETGDCFAATEALARLAEARGADIRTGAAVLGFVTEGARVKAVRTAAGEVEADAFVLCTGVWSAALMRPFGIRLPVIPLKGYSLTIERSPATDGPVSTIADDRFKVGVTHLGERIRVGGTAELAGFDQSAPAKRFAALEYVVRDLFPKVPEAALAKALRWSGLRPATPDGPPVVGRAHGFGNLVLNTGHGTLGWTMAMGSALLVESIIAGQPSPIDAEPFSPGRF